MLPAPADNRHLTLSQIIFTLPKTEMRPVDVLRPAPVAGTSKRQLSNNAPVQTESRGVATAPNPEVAATSAAKDDWNNDAPAIPLSAAAPFSSPEVSEAAPLNTTPAAQPAQDVAFAERESAQSGDRSTLPAEMASASAMSSATENVIPAADDVAAGPAATRRGPTAATTPVEPEALPLTSSAPAATFHTATAATAPVEPDMWPTDSPAPAATRPALTFATSSIEPDMWPAAISAPAATRPALTFATSSVEPEAQTAASPAPAATRSALTFATSSIEPDMWPAAISAPAATRPALTFATSSVEPEAQTAASPAPAATRSALTFATSSVEPDTEPAGSPAPAATRSTLTAATTSVERHRQPAATSAPAVQTASAVQIGQTAGSPKENGLEQAGSLNSISLPASQSGNDRADPGAMHEGGTLNSGIEQIQTAFALPRTVTRSVDALQPSLPAATSKRQLSNKTPTEKASAAPTPAELLAGPVARFRKSPWPRWLHGRSK